MFDVHGRCLALGMMHIIDEWAIKSALVTEQLSTLALDSMYSFPYFIYSSSIRRIINSKN